MSENRSLTGAATGNRMPGCFCCCLYIWSYSLSQITIAAYR
jgi:hypothetical protein